VEAAWREGATLVEALGHHAKLEASLADRNFLTAHENAHAQAQGQT